VQSLKYTTLFIDEKNESHFRDDQADFTQVDFAPPAPPVGLSEFMDVSKMVFFQLPSGWFGDWHPAPKKQFFCCLKGRLEITAGDGERRMFNPGDVFLLEDVRGRGHVTRVIGNEEFVAAVVQLAANS
jgi:quercetin dioxygenase-like cupin family protein